MNPSFWIRLAPVFLTAALAAQSIVPNDNRTPAGTLKDGVLTLQLNLTKADWHPEANDGETIPAYAFAESNKPPQVPAPTIRVPQGTIIDITISSQLPVPVTLHGLHQRPGAATDTITIPPNSQQHLRFPAGQPGTYLYYGRTPDGRRGNNRVLDALLGGALVIDPPGPTPTNDRIFVLERWNGPTRTAINGKSWPYTERLNYKTGEKVHWKIVNASDLSHPMHLHGFHFSLDAVGDNETYNLIEDANKSEEFTHSVEIMQTFDMTWTPKEPGRWLYHCHRIPHMRLPVPLDPKDVKGPAANHDHAHMHDMESPYGGMGGMIIGLTIEGKSAIDTETNWRPARRLAMQIGNRKNDPRFHEITLKNQQTGEESKSTGLAGPPLIVEEGQQTEIDITNTMRESTAVHWHGIEIESYYDGVPGLGGLGNRKAPAIDPGKTFTVRLIPQRPGSFIYHTHWHDDAQLTGGILGAMIVLPKGQKHTPATDKSFIITQSPTEPFGASLLLMNGVPQPATLRLQTGVTYRFRFMNMTPSMDNMRVSLRGPQGLVEWRRIAKDAAPRKPQTQPAEQHIAVSETYDFEYRATTPGELRLEGWNPGDNRRAVQTLIFTTP